MLLGYIYFKQITSPLGSQRGHTGKQRACTGPLDEVLYTKKLAWVEFMTRSSEKDCVNGIN